IPEVGISRSKGIHVLPKKRDFSQSPTHRSRDIVEHFDDRSGFFPSPGDGNDAVGAKLIEALHDIDKSLGFFSRNASLSGISVRSVKLRENQVALAVSHPKENLRKLVDRVRPEN